MLISLISIVKNIIIEWCIQCNITIARLSLIICPPLWNWWELFIRWCILERLDCKNKHKHKLIIILFDIIDKYNVYYCILMYWLWKEWFTSISSFCSINIDTIMWTKFFRREQLGQQARASTKSAQEISKLMNIGNTGP